MTSTQSASPERPRGVDVLGTRVDDVTYEEALALLRAAIQRRETLVVSTPNPEIVMAARADSDYRAVLDRCGLNIPDGIGLLLAARIAGQPLREHVQGTDLVLRLAAESPTAGYRWFLLGGWGDTAERAARALERQFPGIRVVGWDPGSPDPADDAATRELVRAAGPVDVLLVAYGAPKQERWLDRNQAALGVPVGIGVGGVFAYIAGDVPRAPAWVRRIHFEWLHRLLTQPRYRWRRQLRLPLFGILAIAEGLRRRKVAAALSRRTAPRD
ncbi:MAG: WecB/TagA/CpsF family glycosyltransferase [Chloroflexi bacterium]|nr:WecB/TagA/CpsF family glycosyltransferase [Chloroflexota bacterium]